ncbi:putative molybdenum carrier protein [Methylomarinum vadi]|uniref:putative molybdenum carrier protein n=1 Tax=Methylomarinum vadi TaxID=438855 RepID=UPI0004DF52BE|nr:putative molybdenum carrier protein [Methylomarinum vadi]
MAIKIISGGQTGVDRAALDAALSANVPCGGSCPAGRMAEDGNIPYHYPVVELAGADYDRRTEQNVIDSHASLIIYFSHLFGGTLKTLEYCQQHRKPYLLLDGDSVNSSQAAQRITDFVQRHSVACLNVAGPRANDAENAYEFTLQAVKKFLATR